jgi:hypothetical protein
MLGTTVDVQFVEEFVDILEDLICADSVSVLLRVRDKSLALKRHLGR